MSQSTSLILVRHGESAWNRDGRYQGRIDIELSPLGRDQAALVGQRLADRPLSAIYASPLLRAMDTAQAIATYHNLQVVPEGEVTEFDHGVWSGLLRDEIQERFADDLETWINKPTRLKVDGAEMLHDVAERAQRSISAIIRKHPGQTIVVVSHDLVIKVIMALAMGMDLDRVWFIKLDNASVSELEYGERGVRLVSLNDVCHLGSRVSDIARQAL
ncbi:MAG: histidine phosphatase family protein [Chloroflexota bacterium]|nr:MAG: histidine phosphatase family protein [Chloroflexota bacterium]